MKKEETNMKTMLKKILPAILAVMLLMTLISASAEGEKVTVRLGGLKGPTSMGMVKLLEDQDAGLTENAYEFTMAGSPNDLVPGFLKGDLDVLAVPVNLGAVLYQRSEGKVQLAAVNTLGVLYIVEKGGENVQSLEDLRGRTLYATGKGSTPEYALAYLLAQHGMDLNTDLTVEWKSEHTEVVAQMATEENAIALLPQPFVTVAAGQFEGNLRIALDLTKEWESLDNGSQLITGGLVVRKAFAEENPEALAAFLKEYAESTAYTNEQPAEAARLIEKRGIIAAAVAEKAIPFCNIVCITGEEMKTIVTGYYQTLYDQDPEAVGGQMPGDDFFLKAE